jgi:DmsE family decaheme c-type cytochrome
MRRALFVLALATVVALFGGGKAFAQAGAPSATWSATDCQGCHDKAFGPTFDRSKHAKLDQSCANCHQNVGEHAKAQMAGQKGPVPTLKNMSARQVNDTCLKCHEKGNQLSYDTSMHARRNVACTSCHGIHEYTSAKAQLKTKMDADTCYTCHKSMRAKSLRTSHHPVREGKMGCSSCHNPHEGNRPKMINAESVNELCYKCHTEKRGPFLFEHAPVREECASCHDPHGSNHDRLLTKKLPTLCYSCHLTGSGHFGLSDRFGTEKGVPIAPTGAPSGYPTITGRWAEKSCKNCHINIHGSNSPQGAFFVR